MTNLEFKLLFGMQLIENIQESIDSALIMKSRKGHSEEKKIDENSFQETDVQVISAFCFSLLAQPRPPLFRGKKRRELW